VTPIDSSLATALAGRYTIERELGQGGMATVYLAHDLRHDRPVAMKVLRPELTASLGPERFLREVRTTARLDHPHILPLLDSGDTEGILWYTMPYVEGESLRERLRREGQLPIEHALRIASEVADALDYAHEQKIVHRDIKPENILLARGHARVADFGIARALEAAGGGQLTQTGMAVGTPAYMSPEQASGAAVDARSDIYALGCVLYEMLAGEPPFTGPTPQAVIARRFTETPRPLHATRDRVPPYVENAVAQALARTPADRFETASEFARALELVSAAALPSTPALPSMSALWGGRRLAAMLVLGIAIGLGVLFAWRRSQPKAVSSADAAKRVAVLPFENVSSPADAYFADGLTDAVRGKLAAVPGLQVIASTSANQYRGSTKPPRQIAGELGVRYLLVGRVRWDKHAGESRVEVSPELIEVTPTGAPTTRWQEPFDAALSDVFRVQADIATRVAGALDVALGSGTRSELATRPTTNLDAYDAFLKGQEAELRDDARRRAAEYYEQAVKLDPGFATAWARLSLVRSRLYATWASADSTYARQAGEAAERATTLAPELAEGYIAVANYHDVVTNDSRRAHEAALTAMRLAPTNADGLRALALAEQELGRWEASIQLLERARALDPRSVLSFERLGRALLWMHRYREALTIFDRALALAPGDLGIVEGRAMVHLAQGDLAAARRLLREPPSGIMPEAFVAYIATFWDLGWVLTDEQQRLLLRLRPEPFDGDRASWGLALAQVAAFRGDARTARAYADSARVALERKTAAIPNEAQEHALLGVALAYMGRRAEAVREGERGRDLLPISRDAEDGPYQQHQLARIYVLLGEPERALDQLEPLLKIPYYLSPAWLRIDPTFEPLRKHPRFQRLAGR
jgi:eukaryotic-like serine/threonine-protein kinase